MAKTENKWSLQGTTALVTGGTKGIGLAIVEELARFGATVHTCARNESELHECLEKWKILKLNVSGSVCDISSRSEREKLMDTVSSLFQGKLDILINNAAKGLFKGALNSTEEDYSITTTTNLESGFHLSQIAHPLLKASGGGSIVFISSIAGIVALPVSSIYSATKAAINQLTRNLALEWAKDKIRVNCIAPGPIKTVMLQSFLGAAEGPRIESFGCPMERAGEAEEVSPLAAFLCMPVASYITGQVICTDGGITMS
ncbi:hypothetical protein IEQ34_016115 [Dendrobium chrysotoxum]|uniref:Noroxomaritidine/norcraugsodine reductase n=1 Tax=Dendrobium chrysotoxum TaxID=161865 RepID=A0AAV7GD65_DENCH|nr:hypothetical protein IEQ34_016115 [Dendrobium chrysotoxum]